MKDIADEKGFMLVEIIMGISIVAVMLLSLIDAYFGAVNTIYKAAQNQEAVNIAQKHAEEILNMEDDLLISTYTGYENEEGDYNVCVELETESENSNGDVCIEEIKKDVLVEIVDDAVLINGFEMAAQNNIEITIEKSKNILVQPYGINLEGGDSGVVAIWQKASADIERVCVKNRSEFDVYVYHFTNPIENFNEIEIKGQNVYIQENMGDLKNGSRLLRADIRVYCRDDLEAEIVTYRNVRD